MEIHVHIHREDSLLVQALAENNRLLKSILEEIKQMATDLSAELQALNETVVALNANIAALGPAIERELQQVGEAIASGAGAAAALETARTNITSVTDTLRQSSDALQQATARLASDDQAQG